MLSETLYIPHVPAWIKKTAPPRAQMLAYEQIIGFIVGIESVVGMQLPTFPTLTTACATTSTALGDFPSIEVRVSPALPHARTRPSHILTSFLLALRYPALRVRYFQTKLKSDALARALRKVSPPERKASQVDSLIFLEPQAMQ